MNQWVETGKLVAADRQTGSKFGWDVAIEGNYVAVGAANEDRDSSGSNVLNYAGAIYVFLRDQAGTWLQQQKLVPYDRGIGDEFGRSVDISGHYLLAGAIYDNEDASGQNYLSNAGSVYCYEGPTSSTDVLEVADNGVGVYPNPSNGSVNLRFSKLIVQGYASIVDATGKTVGMIPFSKSDDLSIELPTLPGLYQIQITDQVRGNSYVCRVLKL